MVKLHVVLQTIGLAGFPVAAAIAWGVAPAVAVGSCSLVLAGLALEREQS